MGVCACFTVLRQGTITRYNNINYLILYSVAIFMWQERHNFAL
jgi:hypothetical protein